jgi:ankyrin repeat protein
VIDIDACDFTGVTALWLAANHHYPDVIVALLKAGAKTHFRDRR